MVLDRLAATIRRRVSGSVATRARRATLAIEAIRWDNPAPYSLPSRKRTTRMITTIPTIPIPPLLVFISWSPLADGSYGR
jgi:hypothetical protein